MKKIVICSLAFAALCTAGLAQSDDKPKGKGKGDPAKRAAAMLKKLDTDNSGTLSQDEFLASPAAQKMKEDGKDPVKLFTAKDKNKDGELDQEELAAQPKGKGKGKGKKDAE